MRNAMLRLMMLVLLAIVSPALAQNFQISIKTSQVSVGATATLVAAMLGTRTSITIQNHGTTAMYCGSSNAVTTTTGFRLPGVDGASVTIPSGAAVYCITAAGSQTVSVLESF